MSHYVECKPGFKDREALIEALVAVGFERSQIEVHAEAVPLFGYRGDERLQRAHVISCPGWQSCTLRAVAGRRIRGEGNRTPCPALTQPAPPHQAGSLGASEVLAGR